MRAYLELTKPRITALIVVSTAVGYFFGMPGSWPSLIHTLVGTALLASGTAALNQWWESAADSRMRRTERRPIPSGRVGSRSALYFGLAVSALGFADLALGTNLLAAWLGLFTLLSYLLIYTPLKQVSPVCTAIGAVPGAMPPLIGFAAAHRSLTAPAYALAAILFVWQFPHFYAIAWMYRDDYARGGMRMLPVVEPDCRSTARRMVLFGVLLLPVSLLPLYLHMTGSAYAVGAAMLGAWYLHSGLRAVQIRTLPSARRVLLASVTYLPLLYVLMVADSVR
jgi:protoheme IX farnesyltransferase